jgi:hypothetical protein
MYAFDGFSAANRLLVKRLGQCDQIRRNFAIWAQLFLKNIARNSPKQAID